MGETERAPRTRGRRVVTWIGVLLIVSGLGTLAYVGWEFYGTTWMSKRKQADIVEKLQTEWDKPVGAGRQQVGSGNASADAIIRIPRFGDDYAIPVLEGVGDDALGAGYGHFEESAGPGQKGNYALAGHRITHGEPLRNMPDLQIGDEVIVETRTHVHTYRLTTGGDDLVVPFTAGWVVSPLPTNPDQGGLQPKQKPGQRLITLTTCSELFHTDNRMIAFGVLDHTKKKAVTG